MFHSRDLYSGDGAVQLSAEVIITSLFSKTMLGVENRAKSKGGRVTAYVPLALSRCDCANRDVANLELAGSAKGAVFALTLSRLVGPVTIVASPRLAVQKATFYPLACTGVDVLAVKGVFGGRRRRLCCGRCTLVRVLIIRSSILEARAGSSERAW